MPFSSIFQENFGIFTPNITFEEDDLYIVYLIGDGMFKHQALAIWKIRRQVAVSFGFEGRDMEAKCYTPTSCPCTSDTRNMEVSIQSPDYDLGETSRSKPNTFYVQVPKPLGIELATRLNDMLKRFIDAGVGGTTTLMGTTTPSLYMTLPGQIFSMTSNNCSNLMGQLFPEVLPHFGILQHVAALYTKADVRFGGKKIRYTRRKRAKKTKATLHV